jgi:hypothetical protein
MVSTGRFSIVMPIVLFCQVKIEVEKRAGKQGHDEPAQPGRVIGILSQ